MIKKLGVFLTTIFIVVLALLFNKIYASINYAIGNYHYTKQEYQKAKNHYKIAHNIQPDNPNYQDSYIETLIKIPLDYSAQEDLFKLSKSKNSSPAVIEAYKRIEKFRETILSHFEDNYISACSTNYQIIRWDEQKFPLKVYVKPNKNLTFSKEQQVKKAFKEWGKAFNNFFKFEFVNNTEEANIFLDFEFTLDKDASEDNFYTAANTVPIIEGDYLKGMIITINLFDNFGASISDEQFFGTLFHEIGHSLGIMGHSNNHHDLMFISGSGEMTQRDINTMKLLYLLVPDVSNTTPSKMNKHNRIYAPIIIGAEIEQELEQYDKALTYIKRSPDFSIGWSELGDYYYKIKDYPKSIKALLKAKELARNSNERAFINANLGIVYMTMKDYDNAVVYFQNAENLLEAPEWKGLRGFCLVQSGKKNEGLPLMHQALREQPNNLNLGFMLADYYYSEMQISKTIKVLKFLKKNSADFKNSEERKKYKILNLFVNRTGQNTRYSV